MASNSLVISEEIFQATSANGKDPETGGGIELVEPPRGSKPGDRVFFEGEKYESAWFAIYVYSLRD